MARRRARRRPAARKDGIISDSAKRVIFNADDFGISLEVNEAIERANRDGVLRSASLMVSAPATADAIERARRLPGLAVGLHVVLVNGRPALPPDQVPDLIDERGEFLTDLVRAGVRFFFKPGVRRQLENEIRAQFERFKSAGLRLDHADAQCHMHVHPTIFKLILKVGREYGLQAIRIPREPYGGTKTIELWTSLMRARAGKRGVRSNDYVYGVNDVGAMTEEKVLHMIETLPEGTTELFFHPATGPFDGADPGTEHFQWAGELDALLSPRVREALARNHVANVTFGELVSS